MKKRDNICKFVDGLKSKQILTTNFVYENNLKDFISVGNPKNNAMYLVVDGEGALVMQHLKKDLAKGTLFFTFEEISYRIENAKNLSYMYITFTGERTKELFDRFLISFANCTFKGCENLICFWQNCLEKATPQNLDLLSESALLYSFSFLSVTHENNEQYLINEIIKYIDNNFTNSALSLNSVAEEFNYNAKYISRIFKTNTGVNFSQYLRKIRISHAILLMNNGITSIKNVALLSGFSDPFYFSNIFKQNVGTSPREFINKDKSGIRE